MESHTRTNQNDLKPDITSRQDIIILLEYFYDRLIVDQVTQDIFKDIDMEKHIPVITDFWSLVLLGEMGYKGNAFEKHVPLGLEKKHFDCWLHHFNASLDHFYSGEKVEMARQRATSIGHIFLSKLNSL